LKSTLKVFAISNLIVALLVSSIFIRTSIEMSIVGWSVVTGHLLACIGLITSKKYGWSLNMILSINLFIVSIFALVSAQLSSGITSNEGTTSAGTLFSVAIVVVLLVSGWSVFRTNKSDFVKFFNITNQLRITTVGAGVLMAILLIVRSG
jgi:hypothetical protein